MPSAANFLVGFQAGLAWNNTTIAVSGWDFNNEIDLYDVTDTSSGGIQMLIAGIRRNSASFTMWFLSNQTPAALLLVAGATGIITSVAGSISCRVAKTGVKMVINGAVGVQVELKESLI